MNKPVILIQVRALIPTTNGYAIFLGNEEKAFVIYVDPSVGEAIARFLGEQEKDRPLTHDLIGLIMTSLGAQVSRVIINDVKSSTYFGRLILHAENELQQKKIIELDARPSDCIALALQQKAPIYVSQDVWAEVENVADMLEKLQEQAKNEAKEDEENSEE